MIRFFSLQCDILFQWNRSWDLKNREWNFNIYRQTGNTWWGGTEIASTFNDYLRYHSEANFKRSIVSKWAMYITWSFEVCNFRNFSHLTYFPLVCRLRNWVKNTGFWNVVYMSSFNADPYLIRQQNPSFQTSEKRKTNRLMTFPPP